MHITAVKVDEDGALWVKVLPNMFERGSKIDEVVVLTKRELENAKIPARDELAEVVRSTIMNFVPAGPK